MKKILFICKYNRFRSRIAEAYFNKINKNKKIKAKSAGIIKGSPIRKEQIEAAKYAGLDIKGIPKGLDTKILKWQDAIIIVADDIPTKLFENNKKYGKKLIIWKIADARNNDEKERGRIIKQIIKKINSLVKNLGES